MSCPGFRPVAAYAVAFVLPILVTSCLLGKPSYQDHVLRWLSVSVRSADHTGRRLVESIDPHVLLDASAIPANRGGVGRYVEEAARALDRAGVRLTVVCQRRDAEHFGAAPVHGWFRSRMS